MTARLFTAFVLATFLSCSHGPENSLDADLRQETGEVVLAYVNDEPLLQSDFEKYLQFTQGELSEDPSKPPLNQLFRDYLLRRLILEEARAEGLAVSSEEINEFLENRMLDPGSIGDEVLQQAKELLLIQRYLNRRISPLVEVTLRELQTYYELHHDQFKAEDQAHVLEILTDDLETAEKLRSELLETDIREFRGFAQLYSQGVTANRGGDLGIFERGDLPEEFEKVIFSLKPGEISEPFRSDYGYHLFLVEESVPRHDQKFHEVKDEIFEELVTRKERRELNKIFNNLLENASISFQDPTLELNIEETAFDEALLDEEK